MNKDKKLIEELKRKYGIQGFSEYIKIKREQENARITNKDKEI